MFIIWIGAFASLGLVVFGAMMTQFNDVASALGTLVSMGTGVYSYDSSVMSLSSAAILGWHFFVVIFVFGAFGSMNAYVSISIFILLISICLTFGKLDSSQ
jgi:hypothetical protein